METNRWESVLIEWVNCLQLSQSISCINDLKDGEFFLKLIQVMTASKSNKDVDILTCMFKTLKKQYPYCQFDNEKTVHIQDLSVTDLIAITSLLMHYSCILDRRDVLVSPLCHKLSHYTQLSIRVFLEKMQSDLTKDRLFQIIEECVSDKQACTNFQASEWLSAGESPLSSRSPLQEFLRTPAYKVHLQEKDREISKLKSDLDIAHYEKLDIQEELRQQKEQNNKISKELAERIAEMKILRSELAALQYVSPYKNNDEISQYLQRHLKSEIKSLEEYISQLQLEQEGIQKERDDLFEKLASIECEYQKIQEKCELAEQRYDNLFEKYEQQQEEMKNLQEHCIEITSLLEELKSAKASNDSCIEVEMSNGEEKRRNSVVTTSSEDLACAVVEVQLRDALKENVILKNSVKDLQERNEQLQESIKIANNNIEEFNTHFQKLQTERNDLMEKLSALLKVQSLLEETKVKLAEATETIRNISQENSSLVKKSCILETDLSYTKKLLNESRQMRDDLENTIKLLKDKIDFLNKSLEERNLDNELLQKQNEKLQNDLDKSTKTFNNTILEINNLSFKLKYLDSCTENGLRKLEILAFGNDQNNFDYQNKNDVFENIINQIQANTAKYITDKTTLSEKIVEMELLITNLKQEVSDFKKHETITLEEKNTLSENLACAEKKIQEMGVTSEQYKNKIQQLNAQIFNMASVIESKNSNISNLELKYSMLEKQLISTEEDLHQHKSIATDFCHAEKILKQKINEMEKEIRNREANEKQLQEEVTANKKTFSVEIVKLNTQLQQYKEKISRLEIELQASVQKMIHLATVNVQSFKEKMEQQFLNLNQLIDKKVTYLLLKIQSLKGMIAGKSKQYETLLLKKSTLLSIHKNEILQLNQEISNLKMEINKLSAREFQYLDELRNLKDELSETITKYTETLENIQEIKAENELQVQTLTENLHNIISKYNALEKIHNEEAKELKIVLDNNDNLKNSNAKLTEELSCQKELYEKQFDSNTREWNKKEHQLQNQLTQMVSELKELEHKNQIMYENFTLTTKEKETVLEKFNELKNTHKELEANYSSLKIEYENLIQEKQSSYEQLQNDLSCEIVDLKKEIVHLQELLSNAEIHANNTITEKELIISSYEKQLKENNAFVEKLQSDNKSLKENINALTENVKVLDNRLLIAEEKYALFKKLADENLQLNKEKVEQFEGEIIKLKCANSSLETGKQQLQNELSILTDEIKKIETLRLNDEKWFKCEIESKDMKIGQLSEEITVLKDCFQEKEISLEQFKNKYESTCQTLLQMGKEKEEVQSLFKKHKENYSLCMSVLENKITSQANDQIKLYNILTAHYEILKENIQDKKETNRKLQELLQQYSSNLNHVNIQAKDNADVQKYKKQGESEHTVAIKVQDESKKKNEIFDRLNSLSIKVEGSGEYKNANLKFQSEFLQGIEDNLIRAHNNVVKVKNDVLKNFDSLSEDFNQEGDLLINLKMLLEEERTSKEILESKVTDLTNEHFKACQMQEILKSSIERLMSFVNERSITSILLNNFQSESIYLCFKEIEERIVSLINENVELTEKNKALVKEKENCKKQIDTVLEQNDKLNADREKLIGDCESISNEYHKMRKDMENLNCVLEKYNQLKSDYDNKNKELQTLLDRYHQLEGDLEEMKAKENIRRELQNVLTNCCNSFKGKFEALMCQRNSLERVVNGLVKSYIDIQNTLSAKHNEPKSFSEQKQTIEILVVDVSKQFEIFSKALYKITIKNLQKLESMFNQMKIDSTEIESYLSNIEFDEKMEEISDLKDRANDLTQQMRTFEQVVNQFISNKFGSQKETAASRKKEGTELKFREEDYRKKNLALKQRLTLAENAKANLEKKIKQLREENKKLTEKGHSENNLLYKDLLHEHDKTKEEHERVLEECNKQHESIYKEYEEYKAQKQFLPEFLSIEKKLRTEKEQLANDLQNIREAYTKVLSDKSKLELENETLQTLLKDRTTQLSGLDLVKENYTKMLEENNKLKMELDTVKYKRSRDREEYIKLLDKEKEKENRKMQEIRKEYDGKLEKMKEKMIKLYNEEMQNEIQKVIEEKNENKYLLNNVRKLQEELQKANTKICELELEKQKYLEEFNIHQIVKFQPPENDISDSRESLSSVSSRDGFRESISRFKTNLNEIRRGALQFHTENSAKLKVPLDDIFEVPNKEAVVQKKVIEERVSSTLPRNSGMDVIQEVTISRRTSVTSLPAAIGQNLEMEDEEADLFNNKYLTDLKEGRCILPSNKESAASRLSELQWRNSLYPPHLKSSYPAETQFSSPSQFREEDIKAGVVDFDDSMSTRLIPCDKSRKKDVGTTSYKKPGPPTPSKNGGRVSLQGNEIHPRDVLREHNDKTPKRITPSRLKALFMGKNSSNRENVENQQGTPKSRRLSIFRRPK